jgi:hypothetical protein
MDPRSDSTVAARRGQQAIRSVPTSMAAATTAITEIPATQFPRLEPRHRNAVAK